MKRNKYSKVFICLMSTILLAGCGAGKAGSDLAGKLENPSVNTQSSEYFRG